MYSEARKLHLLEEVLKVDNDATLIKLEHVLAKSKKSKVHSNKELSIYDFVGILSKKEAMEINKAIAEACETINPDDWK